MACFSKRIYVFTPFCFPLDAIEPLKVIDLALLGFGWIDRWWVLLAPSKPKL